VAVERAQFPPRTLAVRYDEHLVIDMPLHLVGIERPTLSGGGVGDAIRVKAPECSSKG
jgi:nitrous oxidase accessory protein